MLAAETLKYEVAEDVYAEHEQVSVFKNICTLTRPALLQLKHFLNTCCGMTGGANLG